MADPSAHAHRLSSSSTTTSRTINNNNNNTTNYHNNNNNKINKTTTNNNNNNVEPSLATTTLTSLSTTIPTTTTTTTTNILTSSPSSIHKHPPSPCTTTTTTTTTTNNNNNNNNNDDNIATTPTTTTNRRHKVRPVIYKSTNLAKTAPDLVVTTSPETVSSVRAIQRANEVAEKVRDDYRASREAKLNRSNDPAIEGNDDESNARKYERRLKMNRQSAAASRVRREAYTKALEKELISMEKDYNQLANILEKERHENRKLRQEVDAELQRETAAAAAAADDDDDDDDEIEIQVDDQNNVGATHQSNGIDHVDNMNEVNEINEFNQSLVQNHFNTPNNSYQNVVEFSQQQQLELLQQLQMQQQIQQIHQQFQQQQRKQQQLANTDSQSQQQINLNAISNVQMQQDEGMTLANGDMFTGMSSATQDANVFEHQRNDFLKGEDLLQLDDALLATQLQMSEQAVQALSSTAQDSVPIPDFFLNEDGDANEDENIACNGMINDASNDEQNLNNGNTL